MILATDIARLHASPWYGSFALTGGGVSLAADLLAVPGASGTIADVRVPYAEAALRALLGGTPDQASSRATAQSLAVTMLRNTLQLGAPPGAIAFGFALTASLATATPKRGAHRIHLAIHTLQRLQSLSLELTKGARSRADEERIAAQLGWFALARMAGIAAEPPALRPEEYVDTVDSHGAPHWSAVIEGTNEVVEARGGEVPEAGPRLLFPGSFNPMHDGHRRMAALAEARTGLPVEYELCIANVDKAPLDIDAIEQRVHGLPADRRVWLSRAGTFEAKSALFTGARFVLGLDTLVRIAETRFYADEHARDSAIGLLAQRGCRFIVFPRILGDTFLELDDVQVPPTLRALCDGVSGAAFRADVSSSALRMIGGAAGER